MNEALARTLTALELAVRLSLPLLAAAFLVGLLAALVSAWTRIAEPALSALPRALVTLLVLGGMGSLMAGELMQYTSALFRALPELAR